MIKVLETASLTSSVADPERCDADPDPTFQADADPNPNLFTRVKKFFSSNLQLLFPKSPKTCHCNFLSKNVGGRVRGEG